MKKFIEKVKKTLSIKHLIEALIFFLIAALTFYFVFKNNNFSLLIDNIKATNKWYIFLAVMAMFGYILTEAVNVRRILCSFNDKVSLMKCFKYSLVGFFFSSITPSSTGGQPMQLYFMNKDKVLLSHGTLALLIQLLSFQFVTLVLALVGFVLNYDILVHHIGSIKYLMFFGIVVNMIIQAFLIILIFSKNTGEKLMGWVYNMLVKLHYKKADIFKRQSDKQLSEYHECAMYLKDNKGLLVKSIITTIVQLSLYHGVPYFVYRSFGLNEANIIKFVLMEAVLYISVASLPLPGSMGASEGSFVVMFKMFFPKVLLGSAMIISRGISFYLFIVISLVLIIAFMIYDRYKRKRVEE